MIQNDKLYFLLKINNNIIPIQEKSLTTFNYSYGVLSTIPTWSMRWLDQYHIGELVKGSYPISLEFGAEQASALLGLYSIHSNLDIEGRQMGLPSSGYFDITCHHTTFDKSLTDLYARAYSVKTGSNFNLILKGYGITPSEALKPSQHDIVVYKGTENAIQFLHYLAYFCTNTKNTLGFMLYYDALAQGHLVNFIDKIANATFSSGSANNILITASTAFAISNIAINNSIRAKVYAEAAFCAFYYFDKTVATPPYFKIDASFDALNKLPAVKEEISDFLITDSKHTVPYQIRHLDHLSDLEKEYYKAFIGNHELWEYAQRSTVEISIQGFINDADTEPGSLVKLYNALCAPNGIYVVLQKTYFIAERSGIYTKLYLLFVKKDKV